MLVRHNKAPQAGTARPPQTAAPQAAQKMDAQEPVEAAVIKDLLKSLGIKKYDPRIVSLLMDFTWRTTSDILQEAEAISIAAGGSGAELTPQDIALAASQQARANPQPQPPSLAELHALARRVNAQPLTGPSEKQHGIKLPPVADCLLSQNYQVKGRPRAQHAQQAVPPPRQHYAVKQQHGKMGIMAIPQQWKPAPDAAGGQAEPFAPPEYRQPAAAAAAADVGAAAADAGVAAAGAAEAAGAAGAAEAAGAAIAGMPDQQQQQQQPAAMEVDQEEI